MRRSGKMFSTGIFIGVVVVLFLQYRPRPAADYTQMPPAERAFVQEVEDARAAWANAPNDLARANMRAARAAALCGTGATRTATDWLGTVQKIDPDSFPDFYGKKTARIVIGLADHLSLTTPAAPLLNNPATMVEAGSPIYAAAATLPLGSRVEFSAAFFPGADCMEETSLTRAAGMTNPEFKIQLTALAAK